MKHVPILTWEAAQRMPHPERAWMNRPSFETEPMYDLRQKSGYLINLNNYCMRMEFEKMLSEKGLGMGCPVPYSVRRHWEQMMIERYDPVAYSLIVKFNQNPTQ